MMRQVSLFIFSLALLCADVSAMQVHPTAEQTSTDSLKAQLESVQKELNRATTTIRSLRSSQSRLQADQDSLRQELLILLSKLEDLKSRTSLEYQTMVLRMDSTDVINEAQFASVHQSAKIYMWFGVLVIVVVAVIIGYIMWILLSDLPSRMEETKNSIGEQVNKTHSNIDERIVGEYARITETLEQVFAAAQAFGSNATNATLDHSLVLKVANEINTMERNLSLMDNAVRGHKQLIRTLDNLKNNLSAYGYEIEPLLGRKFDLGLNLQVINAIPNESLETGEELITKIIVPQVNYEGRMIQSAQIEISVGS